MRLICPNCDAQYEVDGSAIPEAGRDVQCSNCGHAWFQMREPEESDPSAELYREPEPAETVPVPAALAQTDADDPEDDDEPLTTSPAPEPARRTLDESVLAVLREEAEREKAARRAEASGIEMQGDLGLPPPVSPAVGSAAAAAAAAAAASSVMSPTEKRLASMKGEPVPPPRPAARRDLLPDIEEINSTLRPTEVTAEPDGTSLAPEKAEASGFRSGFVLMLIVAAVAVALYGMAPQLSQQIPGAAEALQGYVSAVDSARAMLDSLMRRATGALNGITGG